jgi:hypothetical protein
MEMEMNNEVEDDRDQADVDEEEEEEEEEDEYCDYVESIRSRTGLEIGLRVKWPDLEPFELTTKLSEQAIAPLFHGTQWAGTRLWRAAVVGLQYLLSEEAPIEWKKTTKVVELGCGLGVPGMILAMARKCKVVLTDQDDLLSQLETNCKTLLETRPMLSLEVKALDWSGKEVEKLMDCHGAFDVVFNCDCIFEPLYGDSWKYLAECQEGFLRRSPATFMLTVVERRTFDGIEKYLDRMTSSPLVEKVEKISLSFQVPKEVELYRIFGTSLLKQT